MNERKEAAEIGRVMLGLAKTLGGRAFVLFYQREDDGLAIVSNIVDGVEVKKLVRSIADVLEKEGEDRRQWVDPQGVVHDLPKGTES